MQPFPPLGRFIDGSRSRRCGHSPGDTLSTDCPADATWHIMWNSGGEVSLACDRHMARARRFVFLDSHHIGPDCDMPGALWDLDNRRCVYPDEPETESVAVEMAAGPSVREAAAGDRAHWTQKYAGEDR